MARELKNIRLRQVAESIRPWAGLLGTILPHGGWVRSIRQALGMTTAQLGRRMGVTQQAVADLERRESQRGVTLEALARAADALDAELVYAIVPRKSLSEMVQEQTRAVAERQLKRVAHSMRLEDQGVSREEYEQQLADSQERLLRNRSSRIWDEEGPSRKD